MATQLWVVVQFQKDLSRSYPESAAEGFGRTIAYLVVIPSYRARNLSQSKPGVKMNDWILSRVALSHQDDISLEQPSLASHQTFAE